MADEELGPAMSVLTAKQRAFVRAVVSNPLTSGANLAREAGYSDHMDRAKVAAHLLFHNEKVLEAIEEETRKRVRFGGAIGVAGLIKMAANSDHPDHFRACASLADRGGFAAKTEHKVLVEHVDHGRMAEIAATLAKELGLDRMKLIGGNVIEGKAEIVEGKGDEIGNTGKPGDGSD